MVSVKTDGKHFAVARFKLGEYNSILVYEIGLSDALPYLKDGFRRASKLLAARGDFVVFVTSSDSKFVKERMGGTTGATLNGYNMAVRINKGSKTWKTTVGRSIAHEYCHIVRFQAMGSRMTNLAEDICTEGLAQCFEEKIIGERSQWSQAISEKKAGEVWNQIKDRLALQNHDLYKKLFTDGEEKEFPLWAGYTVSYQIIRKGLADFGKFDWNETIRKDPIALIGKGLS